MFSCTALILAGCASTTSSGNSALSLIDLSPGNSWSYRMDIIRSNSRGSLTEHALIRLARVVDSVGGDLCDTVFQTSYKVQIPDFLPLLASRGDGIWERITRTSAPIHRFKYPASVGESWKLDPTDTNRADQEFSEASLVAIEPITVGKVTYGCFVYQYTVPGGNHGETRTIYIAPGFTIVKGVYTVESAEGYDTTMYTIQP